MAVSLMAKIVCTIWALILHSMGIYIFQTCLSSPIDDDCEELVVKSQPLATFLVTFGIYVIITQISLFPSTFQEPPAFFLCFYELLATIFILEFCVAYIWNPLDLLMLSTLPKKISHLLYDFELGDAEKWIEKNQTPLKALSLLFGLGFFLMSIHVSKAVDFSVIIKYGIVVFLDLIVWNLYQRFLKEFPIINSLIFECGQKRISRGQQTITRCKKCNCLKEP